MGLGHVPDAKVTVGVSLAGDRHEAAGGIDAGADGALDRRELDREAGPARDVEQVLAGSQTQTAVHGDVLTHGAGFEQSGEVCRPATPALVDHPPAHRVLLTSGRRRGRSRRRYGYQPRARHSGTLARSAPTVVSAPWPG